MSVLLRVFNGARNGRTIARSIFWSTVLRSFGVDVGRNVRFGGQVRWKFQGDPKRIRIGNNVTFAGLVDLRNRENGAIQVEDDCLFDNDARIVAAREATIRVGTRTAVGKDLVINAGADVFIGPNCLFSSYIHINAGTHRVAPGRTILAQGYHHEPVIIGADVWLASNVNVLMSSVLGDGVVVGPNSVVCGEFPYNSMLLGVPATIVGRRGEDCSELRLMTQTLERLQTRQSGLV
ncbi:MAG: acyltransferase [Verrucomicrobia bacterium]|nr:acyltransferase [Verrucomicrobiota bacterium]